MRRQLSLFVHNNVNALFCEESHGIWFETVSLLDVM